MNPFLALRDHAKEVYDTLAGNERIKERSRGLYDQVVNRGVKPSFPMLLKDPQNVTMDDLIASGFGVMPMAIKAYHGSPHLFDKFDMSKIGAGEGAQAYGNGLYMAESPDLARTYIDASRNGESGLPAHVAYMKAANYPKDEIKMFEDAISNPNEKTSFYETSLQWPDPAREAADPMGPQHFLDWDRPFNNADELERFAAKFDSVAPEYRKILEDWSYGNQIRGMPMPSGQDIVEKLSGIENNANSREFSNIAYKAGIPGIRYLDQGSRGAGQGSYNYVVFDDSIPKIVKRNGKPVNTGLPPTQFSKAHETAQRNAALPVEQGGLGLPPDNTAMDRARAMGFDMDVYHGSDDISSTYEFDPNKIIDNVQYGGKFYHSIDPYYASKYADNSLRGESPGVMPLMIRSGKRFEMDKPISSNDAYKIIDNAGQHERAKKILDNNVNYNNGGELFYWGISPNLSNAQKGNLIFDSGFDSIHGDPSLEITGKPGKPHTVVNDPTRIRSRFAAFDPFKRNSADILATGIMGSLLLNELKNRNAQDKPRYR